MRLGLSIKVFFFIIESIDL